MTGSLMLLKGRSEGIDQFDVSVDGFWRSFQAALIVAPGFALTLWLRPDFDDAGLTVTQFWLKAAIAFLVAIVQFPLLALLLCSYFDLKHRFVPLIVASNWVAVIQTVIFVTAVLFAQVSGSLGDILLLVVTVSLMYFQWFVIQTALKTAGTIALAYLTLDMIIGMITRTQIHNWIAS